MYMYVVPFMFLLCVYIYIYIPMFIAVPVTITKIWKQSKCPSIDEWKKMWYIYTMEYLFIHKIKRIINSSFFLSIIYKFEILPFAAIWIDMEGYYVK